MSGSNVQGNIARNGSGGGLAVFDNVRCELSNNTRVRHNEATTFGGGLFAANNTLVSVVYADVEHNKASDSGGGIGAFGASSVDLMNASNVNETWLAVLVVVSLFVTMLVYCSLVRAVCATMLRATVLVGG
jgi:parallel beta-helix repeat protein